MRTERSFSEGLVELTRARERLQFAIATGRRGARAHAQSGLVAHPGRGLDKSRPSLAPNWVLLTPPPQWSATSGRCLGAGRGGACLSQGGGRASGNALLPAPSPKCHRGVGGRLQAERFWPCEPQICNL